MIPIFGGGENVSKNISKNGHPALLKLGDEYTLHFNSNILELEK